MVVKHTRKLPGLFLLPNGKDPGDEVVPLTFSCLLYFYFRFCMRRQYILVSNDYVSMRKQRPASKRKWNMVFLEKLFKIEGHVMNRQRLKRS